MAEEKKKLITREHLDAFFDAIDIDLRGILAERSEEHARQAAMRPGLGECTDQVYEEKHSSEVLEKSMNQTIQDSKLAVDDEKKVKVNQPVRKYRLPTFRNETRDNSPVRLPSTSKIKVEDGEK